jgi:starch synthase
MPGRTLNIVSIAAETAPFAKTGGLADVSRSLPEALHRLGHSVIAIMPFYGQVIDADAYGLERIYENIPLVLNSAETVSVDYWRGKLECGVPVYFVECAKYFSQRKTLYRSGHENARFLVFSVAALKLISLLKFAPDIIQCHDWHTGLIPFYLKTDFRYSKTLRKARTVFTIHNLTFQFGTDWWTVPPERKDNGRSRIPHLSDPGLEYLNFAKRAILSADAITTVSEKYRDEIQSKEFGQDLDRFLRNRKDRLFGIVNGIDFSTYNPANDPGLKANYNYRQVERKEENKAQVQKSFGLAKHPRTPLICSTSRVTFQKGFELILKVMDQLLRIDLQLVFLGSGDAEYIKGLRRFARKFPKRVAVLPTHEDNQKYETLVYAGADLFLLPSYSEPCGINQLIAMRYGCIPVVRKVGGLHDTVVNYNPATGKGTGFTFDQFDEFSLYRAVVRATEAYRYEDHWRRLQVRAMRESNSWEIPAKKYIQLFRHVLKFPANGNRQ